MRTTFAPHLGREVRVGGCRVEHLHLRHALAMSHIVGDRTLTVPNRTTFSANTSSSFQAMLAGTFLNNQLGDCVIAARARRIGVLTGNASSEGAFIYRDDQLLHEYRVIGGYIPGKPETDNGCDPTVSADHGVRSGYADGSKDVGWVAVNATNWHEVMLANHVTSGACDLSMALPAEWLNSGGMPQRNGDVWDVAGDPVLENGHCVAVVDHDAEKGLLVDTWGLLVWVTPRAVARYGAQRNNGILIAHVNHDAVGTIAGRAPNGLDWTTLLTYFDHDLKGSAQQDA